MSGPPPAYAPGYAPPPSNAYPPPAPGYGPPPPGGSYGPPPPGGSYGPPPPGGSYGPPPPSGSYGPPPPSGSYAPPPQMYQASGYGAPPQHQAKVYKGSGGGGLFGSLGKDLSKGMQSLIKEADNAYSKATHGSTTDVLQTGVVVQFQSRNSGRLLQIVQGPDGNLTVDGSGPDVTTAFNTLWTVYRESTSSVVRLYNYNNYLCMKNGIVGVTPAASPMTAPPNTRWKVYQSDHYIVLQNLHEVDCHIGVRDTGVIMLGRDCKSLVHNVKACDFGIKVVQGNRPVQYGHK